MIFEPTRCPLCGTPSVTTKAEVIAMRNGAIEARYATCDECGSEVNPDNDDLFVIDLARG